MQSQQKVSKSFNLRRSPVSRACVAAAMMVAAPGVFAAAGFGDSNGPDGGPIRVQTYYAHSPSGVRVAVPAEAAAIIPGYTGNTGKALRKFIDPLPQVGATANTLSDGITSKFIPAAVATKWKNPAGVATLDDYYEIAVVEYTEKMHSDLKNPTRVRGYVQIDHLASNSLGLIPGSISFPLTYPSGAAIMIPATDINGKLTGGAPVQALAVAKPHYLGPAIGATRYTATRIKFHNLLPVGRYDGVNRNGDLFVPVDETLAGAGVGPDGVTRYTQNRAELHLHGGDTPWISDGTPHQWITPAGERDLLTAEMAASGSPLSVDTFLRGPGAINVPDMNEPGEGAMTYYYPNRQSARLEWYHDHSYGLTRLNAYVGEAAPYVLSDPGQDTMLNTVAGFPADTIHLVIQDKTFVPEDIKLQDGRWNAKVDAAGNHPLVGAPLWGEASDLWYPHVYEVNQEPSNGLDGTNPVGRWDWGPYFWPVFPSLYNLPTGGVDDVTLTPEAWMDTPVINGVAYPTLTVQPRAQRFKILNGANDRFWNLSFFLADSQVSEVLVAPGAGGSGYNPATTTVALTSATGTGATAEPVVDALGTITAIRVTNAGTGYSSLTPVTVNITDTGTPAAGVVAAIPGGTGASATVTVSDSTEVKMVPAGPIETTGLAACATDANGVDIAFPYAAACLPSTWPTDGRAGGVPDPRTAGPKMYQIGTEGGLLPHVAEIAASPMQYEYNRRSITVLNTFSHGLFMGNAERADIVVDFSPYAGKTLIMYSDSPAPVPAFDPRNDHWTSKPDETTVGSVDTPKAGFGPNTRTLMQIKVDNSAAIAQAAVAAAQAQVALATTASVNASATAATDAAAAGVALAASDAAAAIAATDQAAVLTTLQALLDAIAAGGLPNPVFDAAVATYNNAVLTRNASTAAASVALAASNVAANQAALSATAANSAALALANANTALVNAQAALGAVPVFVPLDVAALKLKVPEVYADAAFGQEKPIVAQSAYNDAFGTAWSDAPQLDGTKAFATIFTGSLQEPTFKFTPGTPNGGFDKVTVLTGGSGYITPPVPVIGAPGAGGVQATAATTLRVAAVTVASPGAGYKFAPVVTFGNTGTGSGAAAVARMQVSNVLIANGGSAYAVAPAVTFSAPDSRVPGAIQATGHAVLTAGVVTSVVIDNPGNGYTTAPLVAFAAGAGTRATGSTELSIRTIDLVSNDPNHPEFAGGAGYSDMTLVTVIITAPTAPGAVPAVTTLTGAVSDITLTNSGSGYLGIPVVIIPPPAVGVQATALASIGGGSILVKNKAIQELFDPTYGRMNATLGIEIPFTSALTQTTIPLGYVDPVTEEFADGETQIWKITHNGVDAHPVHFHLLNVQLINRIGWDGTIKPPMDNEYGWKETIRMNPLEDVVVAVRAKKPVLPGFGLPFSQRLRDPSQPQGVPMGFTQINAQTGTPAVVTNEVDNLGWEYVWHCHILGHEENDFMRPIKFNANEAVPAIPTITPLLAGSPVSLAWVDNSVTEYKYEVTRTSVMAPGIAAVAAPAVKLLANSTSYSEVPPAVGGNVLTYSYQVAAVGANGTGAASVLVPVDVVAPGTVTAAFATYNSAKVSWTDNSVNETQFVIEQSTDNVNWTVVSTPNSVTTVAINGVATAVVNGLMGGNTYYFRVSAKLVIGATTFASLPSPVSPAYAALAVPALAAPTTVAFTIGANSNMLTATFKDASVSETDFVVSANGVVLKSMPSTTVLATGGIYNSGAIDLSALPAGTNYTIGVKANDSLNTLLSTSTNAPRTLNVTAVPTVAVAGTPTVAVAAPNRNFTVPAASFTVPTQTATMTYMPVSSYEVTYCQVTAASAANALLAACAGAATTTTMAYAPKTLNLGAALTGTNWYKYVIKAKNLAGTSIGTKTAASR
jgi:FtsP/CotA-like multicopper oxidase with cupredoxin domain